MLFGRNSWEKNERRTNNQNSKHVSKIIYGRVTMHRSNTSTVRSVVSELQTLIRNVLAWYATLLSLVRTFKQRSKVPYPYLHKKCVPNNCIVVLAKIEAYRTVLADGNVPYCHPCVPVSSETIDY